jgi:hypothetical protein
METPVRSAYYQRVTRKRRPDTVAPRMTQGNGCLVIDVLTFHDVLTSPEFFIEFGLILCCRFPPSSVARRATTPSEQHVWTRLPDGSALNVANRDRSLVVDILTTEALVARHVINHPLFAGVKKIYMKEVADIALSKEAKSVLKDAETGKRIWVDTSDKRLRTSYKHAWGERKLALQKTFTRSGVDSVAMSTSEDYVKALMKLFKMRA